MIEPNEVPDTAHVIVALPDTGYVHVSKNGYRLFDLDAIVTDEDDADSTIRWTFAPGPALEVRLQGDMATIGPLPNQVCTSYVVFTATDPVGQSTSKTCPILVFDEFKTGLLPNTITVGKTADTTVSLVCQYRPSLEPKLTWGAVVCDTTYLARDSLYGTPTSGKLAVKAKTKLGTTGVQFTVHDPVNHVDFTHSIPVVVHQ